MRDLRSLILRHTQITRRHLTPELSLRLITPECPLWSGRSEEVPFHNDPFWGFYWPGGQAVARFILDKGMSLANRSVLDIGCGCGAGSVAARIVGAKTVLANDIDPCALIATKINAALNDVSLETSAKDFIGQPCRLFDVILIGDMFYDEEFAAYLFQWLLKMASEGKTVIVGDPGRHGLCESRRRHLCLLARYKLPENSCLENRGFQETSVWKVIQ